MPRNTLKIWDRVTLLVAISTLTCWVILRFFTKSVNFDLVGQQLLARQWIEGDVEGSVIGPTNYILKIIFLYIPSELLGVDQKMFMAVATVIVNAVTFIGIYIVLRRIMRHFSVKGGGFFNSSMLWLAAAAGSVFWVQYTNSRNIELLAGLCLLYLGLLLYRELSLRLCLWFVLLASVTYFSDPLQLFIVSVALVVYITLHTLMYERDKQKEVLFTIALVVVGYLFSKILIFATQEITGVEFIAVSARPPLQEIIKNLPLVGLETIKNVLRLLAGTNEIGVWRQILNIAMVGLLSLFSIMTLVKNKTYAKYQSLVLFVATLIVVPIAVYVASGQPLFRADTSRYLISLAPALIMLFSISDTRVLPMKLVESANFTIIVLLSVSIGSLFLVTLQQSDGEFLATSHLENRYSYLETNGYRYGYASMDTAIPSMYFLARDKSQVLLPLSCENGTLRKSTLFYDKSIFTKNEGKELRVPIILDGDSITNYPYVCSLIEIKHQLGDPVAIESHGGNTILVYESRAMSKIGF